MYIFNFLVLCSLLIDECMDPNTEDETGQSNAIILDEGTQEILGLGRFSMLTQKQSERMSEERGRCMSWFANAIDNNELHITMEQFYALCKNMENRELLNLWAKRGETDFQKMANSLPQTSNPLPQERFPYAESEA